MCELPGEPVTLLLSSCVAAVRLYESLLAEQKALRGGGGGGGSPPPEPEF